MTDLYAKVTEAILSRLRRGTVPWVKPWGPAGEPTNLHTGKRYRGVNVWLLGGCSYPSPYWITYRQATERGGTVRRGERGQPIFFWQFRRGDASAEAEAPNREGVIATQRAPILRQYTVFNVSQCDGLAVPAPPAFVPIATAEEIARAMKDPPELKHSYRGACYAPGPDRIEMPPRERFLSPLRYYATLWHELAHSTGHPTRLDRKGIRTVQPFGTPEYSREELVAEITTAYLCAQAGIENETIQPTAAYLEGWLSHLTDDPRAFLVAAGQAQRAAEWICPALTALDGERPQA